MPAKNEETQSLSIREQLELAQLEEILEKKRAKQADKDRAVAVQMSVVASVKAGEAKRKRAEENCRHTKENSNKTNLSGNRDSNGDVIFICQNCGKDFNMQTCPPYLYPEAIKIGGPIQGQV